MAGNEKAISEYILIHLGKLKLNHLGIVKQLSVPGAKKTMYEITNVKELIHVTTQSSSKKADVYINGRGVSFKQSGANFGFNRMQRSELVDLFTRAELSDPNKLAKAIDKAIDNYHSGTVKGRNRPWGEIMNETDFKKLMKYLLTIGSPNLGDSEYPAEYILEAPKEGISAENISVYTFDEYFERYKDKHRIALRRCWVGQISDSEHYRAVGLASKPGNKKWVYTSIGGQPGKSKTTGERWRKDVKATDRRTVYIVFIEKLK